MLALTTAKAQSTTTILSPEKVVITETDTLNRVEVFGNKENPSAYYKSETHKKEETLGVETKEWTFSGLFIGGSKKNAKNPRTESYMGDFYYGWLSGVNTAKGVDLDFGSSYEIGLEKLFSTRYIRGNDYYTVGLGFGWKRYCMKGSKRFVKDGDNLVISDYPTGANPEYSRVMTFSLLLPLQYGHKFSRNLIVSAGPIININTHASMRTKYRNAEGAMMKDFNSHIHQTPITVDLKAQFDLFGFLGIYFKYSPCNVLRTSYGPQLSSYSVGVCLF